MDFELKPSHVYALYRWYKNELHRYFGWLPQEDFETVKRFFATKQDHQQAFQAMLKHIPEEDHPIIYARLLGLPLEPLDIIHTFQRFGADDKILLKLFGAFVNPNYTTKTLNLTPLSISCEDLDWLEEYYRPTTLEHIRKILYWAVRRGVEPPAIIVIAIQLLANQPARLMCYIAPWYFQLTKRVLWFVNDELKGFTTEEFIRLFQKKEASV